MGAFRLLVFFFFHGVFGRINSFSVIVLILVDINNTRSFLYDRSRFITHFCQFESTNCRVNIGNRFVTGRQTFGYFIEFPSSSYGNRYSQHMLCLK